MQYKITEGEKGKVEIKVDVPASAFDAVYDEVLAAFAKDANIAGFRRGKAPAEVVENHVGHGKILNKAASTLISKNLGDILKKEDLVPLASPKIGIDSLAKGSPFSFTVSFVKKPQVKIGDWKKIKVAKVKAKEITDEDVNRSIKNIFEAWRKNKSKVESQSEKSGGIKDGSRIAEVTEKTEGTESTGKFIYDAHGNKIFIKSDTSEVKNSSTSEVESEPDDKVSPSTSAQDKVDDDFARAIGARDLAHLRELVKKDLETLVANQVEAKLEEELFEKLAEIGTVEIPDILIDDELNRMIVRLNSELERQGKKIDEWLAEQKISFVELRSKWRDQAIKNVKITLIMDEIGKEEKVQVTREEIEKSMANINSTKLSEEQKHDLENYLVISIFQAKTLDLIKKAVAGLP